MAWRWWGLVLMTAGVACTVGVVVLQVRADRRNGGRTAPLPAAAKVLFVTGCTLTGWGVVAATVGLFRS